MTISKLIKILQKMELEYGSRIKVCADTDNLRRSCNDTWQVIDLNGVGFESVPQVDGDGFQISNTDGTERFRNCIVLR